MSAPSIKMKTSDFWRIFFMSKIRKPGGWPGFPVFSKSDGEAGSPLRREGKAPDARLVYEAGVVVEVDHALEVLFVGDIAAKC